MKTLVLTSLVTLASSISFAAEPAAVPANNCQAKALAVAQQEIKSALGATDAIPLSIRQTNWLVVIQFYSPSRVRSTNPAGQVDSQIAIKNIQGGECEVGGAEVDEYDTRG